LSVAGYFRRPHAVHASKLERLRHTCPTRMLLDRIADKWAVLCSSALGDAPCASTSCGARSRAFAENAVATLKSLERDALSAAGQSHRPVTVEYSITPLGETLSATVDSLRIWRETHMEQVLLSQQQYDAGGHQAAPTWTPRCASKLDLSPFGAVNPPHFSERYSFRPADGPGGRRSRPTAAMRPSA